MRLTSNQRKKFDISLVVCYHTVGDIIRKFVWFWRKNTQFDRNWVIKAILKFKILKEI